MPKKAKLGPDGRPVPQVRPGHKMPPPPTPVRDALKVLEQPKQTHALMFDVKRLPEQIRKKSKLYADRNAMREAALELSGNGLELVVRLMDIIRGDLTFPHIDKTGEVVEVGPDQKTTLAAIATWFKYFGPPPVKTLEITGANGGPVRTEIDITKLAPEEQRQMFQLLDRASPESDAEIVVESHGDDEDQESEADAG